MVALKKSDISDSIQCVSTVTSTMLESLSVYERQQVKAAFDAILAQNDHVFQSLLEGDLETCTDALVELLGQFKSSRLGLSERKRLQCKSLLQFALTNCYLLQEKYEEAFKVLPNQLNWDFGNIFKSDVEEKMFVSPHFVEQISEKLELSKVEVYARALMNGLFKPGSVAVLPKFLELSFAHLKQLSKTYGKSPQKLFDPIIETLSHSTDKAALDLFSEMIKELLNEKQYQYAHEFASKWNANDADSYLVFLETDLPFDQAVELERSVFASDKIVASKNHSSTGMRVWKYCETYRNLLPFCARDFGYINGYIAEGLDEILSPLALPLAIAPQHLTVRCHRSDLVLFEKDEKAVLEKLRCSPAQVYSLLLDAAIVLNETSLVEQLLKRISELDVACLTPLTFVDSTGYSPIARCLQSGNPAILEMLKTFIGAQKDRTKVAYMIDLGPILSFLEFPRFEELLAADCYELFLKPLYWDLDPVVEFLSLMGVTV